MIGIIGDDLTGCTDIAILFKNYGLKVIIYNDLPKHVPTDLDVIVINTESRFIDANEAYKRVYEATLHLKQLKCKQFFNKTCSVFRGNIGSEFDAMIDALRVEHAYVVLGYPRNGRTTLLGKHYVHDILLGESQFKNDPMNPMSESTLTEIIQQQSKYKAYAVTYLDLDKGFPYLANLVNSLKSDFTYFCFDIRDDQDFLTIYQLIKNEIMICGAAQIGELFASDGYQNSIVSPLYPNETENKKVLILSGSVTIQTKQQIFDYQKYGDVFYINPFDFIDESSRKEAMKKTISYACHHLQTKDSVLLAFEGAGDAEKVTQSKAAAKNANLSEYEFTKLLSSSLAIIAKEIINHQNIHNIIVLGGDTSYSFCEEFGITHFEVIEEIEAGIASAYYAPLDFTMILKSGSFGTTQFLKTALTSLLKRH